MPKIQDRNEARIIQDIARLILPSAETLATYGATNLNHLIEGVDEGWIGNIPVEGPRPQPDYSVGFRRSAFTDEQLNKLDPLIGSVYENSFFIMWRRNVADRVGCWLLKAGGQAKLDRRVRRVGGEPRSVGSNEKNGRTKEHPDEKSARDVEGCK